MSRLSKIIFTLLLFCSCIALIFFSYVHFEKSSPNLSHETTSGTALIGGPFSLKDHNGQLRKSSDFKDQLLMIYFGYSYCPDICPTALSSMSQALTLLGENAQYIQPFFITVDPERDTESLLKSYVQTFHPRLLGLYGTKKEIETLKKHYRLYAEKAPPQDNNDPHLSYLIDHSSLIYIVKSDGTYLTHFSHGTSPEEMAKILSKTLKENPL